MPENDLPDWTTEMDEQILEKLNIGWTFTPAVIADNIGRSREAVSRRLNTLEAGGLVEKVDRGKYRITEQAQERMGISWERVVLTPEEREEAREEEREHRKAIMDSFGLTLEEYHEEITREYERLKSEKSTNSDELLEKAIENVEKRFSTSEE